MNIVEYGAAVRAIIIHNLGVIRDGGPRSAYLVPHGVSEPGVGKTQTMQDVARSLGNEGWELFAEQGATADSRWRYQDADFQTRDSADLAGSPWVADGRSIRMRPDWLPLGPDGNMVLLAVDELAQAPMENLNIAGTLFREGRIGEHALPAGCMLAAASNPHGSRTGTKAIPGQVKSRLIRLDVQPDVAVWAHYAASRRMSPYVIAFNRARPAYHHAYDPDADAYPCGRSWEQFDATLKIDLKIAGAAPDKIATQTRKLTEELLAGCVGEAAAHAYLAFQEAHLRLPDIEMILRDPLKAPLPEGLDVTFVTMQILANRAEPANFHAIVDYISRMPEAEYAQACVSDAVHRTPSLKMHGAFGRWEANQGNDASAQIAQLPLAA